jgi:hypothetical protein
VDGALYLSNSALYWSSIALNESDGAPSRTAARCTGPTPCCIDAATCRTRTTLRRRVQEGAVGARKASYRYNDASYSCKQTLYASDAAL